MYSGGSSNNDDKIDEVKYDNKEYDDDWDIKYDDFESTTQTNLNQEGPTVTSIGGQSNRRFIMTVIALSASFAGFVSLSGVVFAKLTSNAGGVSDAVEAELHEIPYLAPDDYGGGTYANHYADYYADNDTV